MSVISEIEKGFKKQHVVDVRSGDTVRVYQKIREGGKERVQYFEGLVIRVDRKNSHTASITVRRIASGVGVEKTYLLHSPLVTKIEVKKRSKVRRNYLSYMRERTGKSARLSSVDFDHEAVNKVPDVEEKPLKAQPDEKPAEETHDNAGDKQEDVKPEATKPEEDNKPKTEKPEDIKEPEKPAEAESEAKPEKTKEG